MSFFRINRYEFAAAIGLYGALMLFVDAAALNSELPLQRICFEYLWPVPAPQDSLRVIQSVAAFHFAGTCMAVAWWLERRARRKRLLSQGRTHLTVRF